MRAYEPGAVRNRPGGDRRSGPDSNTRGGSGIRRGGYILVRLRSQRERFAALVKMLRPADGSPVVDKTPLTGKYDFTLEYTTELPNATPGDPPVVPDLFIAVQQQLGLQLVRKKVPFDVLIIDSVSKLPGEN